MRIKGIAAKIWLSVGVIAGGYVLSVTLNQYQGRLAEVRLRATAEAQFPVAQETQLAEASFDRAMRAYSDAVMTEDAALLEKARSESGHVVSALAAAAKLEALDDESRKAVDAVAVTVRDTVGDANSIYSAAIAAHGNLSPDLQGRMRTLAPRNEAVKAELHKLAAKFSTDLKAQLETLAQASGKQRSLGFWVFLVTILVAGIAVQMTIRRAIILPVTRAVEGIRVAAEATAGASERVTQSGRHIADGATEQAASVQQTAASVHEILAVAKQNAQLAGETDHLMQGVEQRVKGATETMAELTGSMKQISDASNRISGVLKTIEDIAFHTNILALNAAVEAARAGSHGLGFGVVADEVRALAHRASDAAKSTAELIEQTVNTAQIGSDMVARTATAFSGIVTDAVTSTQSMNQIRAASQNQAEGIEQINRAIQRIEQITSQNVMKSQETAEAAASMDQQVHTTRQFVGELAEVVGGAARS